MIRVLPSLLTLALSIYCLIECIQAEEDTIRHLPRWAWMLLVLFFPLVGSIAWLVAGRPLREDGTGLFGGAARPRTVAPDDDEEFLRELDKLTREEEERRRRGEGPAEG